MHSKIAILTSKESWFIPYAEDLTRLLKKEGYAIRLVTHHTKVPAGTKILFILSYFRMIPKHVLDRQTHNLVVHESDLPKGKGCAPLFWQILEGKNKIPIVLFEAAEKMDAGNIYLKNTITLKGDELHDEIRALQAAKTAQLVLKFLKAYPRIKGRPQKGKSSYYPRRTPKDSALNLDKTLRQQFNLLRIVSNKDFPAFFIHKGKKYILKIEKESYGKK